MIRRLFLSICDSSWYFATSMDRSLRTIKSCVLKGVFLGSKEEVVVSRSLLISPFSKYGLSNFLTGLAAMSNNSLIGKTSFWKIVSLSSNEIREVTFYCVHKDSGFLEDTWPFGILNCGKNQTTAEWDWEFKSVNKKWWKEKMWSVEKYSKTAKDE